MTINIQVPPDVEVAADSAEPWSHHNVPVIKSEAKAEFVKERKTFHAKSIVPSGALLDYPSTEFIISKKYPLGLNVGDLLSPCVVGFKHKL